MVYQQLPYKFSYDAMKIIYQVSPDEPSEQL
jgi:hypothetical protein